MNKLFFTVLALCTFCWNANSQKEGLNVISANDLKAYMTFFASDEMSGRETGTAENNASALFLKANIMRLGLKPVTATGDFFQNIPLISTMTNRKDSFLKIMGVNGEIIMSTDSVISLMTPEKTMDTTGNIVFAGYGYENKTSGYNDFENIDIKGKMVIIMTRNPEAVNSGSGKTLFDESLESVKFGSIISRGPAAVLFVYDPKNSFSDAYKSGLADLIPQNSLSFKGSQDFSIPLQVLFITRRSADELLRPTGYTLARMQERIMQEGKPVSSEVPGITASVRTSVNVSEISAPNVIGIIEGSDAVLKNECIIYTAHFDHIGKNGEGVVCNGADDNASGSMALLEVAEAYMNLKKKPLRTIVFAWVNGEEKGLLGSKFYTENPVIPMGKTVVDINLDMVGRSKTEADTGKFYGYDLDITNNGEINVYTNHESSELIQIMNNAAKEAGIKIIDKGDKMDFGSSDHACFMAKGVPALLFNSGIHRDLHNIGDDVEKIDFDKIERSAKMTFLIGYKVANQKNRIRIDGSN